MTVVARSADLKVVFMSFSSSVDGPIIVLGTGFGPVFGPV
jgi:hypothetical protein